MAWRGFIGTSPYRSTSYSSPTQGSAEPSTSVERVKRHEKYYLHGGDVFFLVQNYRFRVHRYFFERESGLFREKLGVPASAGQTARGATEANAVKLEDVKADDFARFLWVFYNPKYTIYDATVDDWECILKLAFDWRFEEVKNLCCRELEKLEIEPVRKVKIYQSYGLDEKLLIPSYAALILRPELPSIEEARNLGLETAMQICKAREWVGALVGIQGPAVAQEYLNNIIKDVFGLTPPPATPRAEPQDFISENRMYGIPQTPIRPVIQTGSIGAVAGTTSPVTARTRPASPTQTIPLIASFPSVDQVLTGTMTQEPTTLSPAFLLPVNDGASSSLLGDSNFSNPPQDTANGQQQTEGDENRPAAPPAAEDPSQVAQGSSSTLLNLDTVQSSDGRNEGEGNEEGGDASVAGREGGAANVDVSEPPATPGLGPGENATGTEGLGRRRGQTSSGRSGRRRM